LENQYVRGLRIRKKSVSKRLYAAVCLLLVAVLLLSSASYAWLVLSANPEVSAAKTNIIANGSLEIALGKDIGRSAAGDSFDKNEVTRANRTWGNLIDLSDESYGLQEITLRPAMLNAVGGAVNTLHPFAYPIYGDDGRVDQLYANNVFAGTYNGSWFVTSPNEYGVRAIGTTMYTAPGLDNTFGPLSQRQEVYYDAYNNLWHMTASSYTSLCERSQSVLIAYCNNGTGVSASEFDLTVFSEYVNRVVSSGNEELRLNFTLLAASEATPAENYFTAMELLEEEYPRYESVQPLVSDAIQTIGAADAEAAIAELRAFQNAANQLKSVVDSGEIDASDGYSMEEIEQTVGLIFDLEKTSFTETTKDYWSKVIPNLHYRKYLSGKYWWWDYLDGSDFAVNDLTTSTGNGAEQDNDSRGSAASISHNNMHSAHYSLPLAELDRAIADLYVSHWSYWDTYVDEYQQKFTLESEITQLDASIAEQQEALTEITEEFEALKQQIEAADPSSDTTALWTQLTETEIQANVTRNEISTLEAERLLKADALAEEEARLQPRTDFLTAEERYAFDGSQLEALRFVLNDTIEVLRQYTLWNIAYYACGGRVPDDGYRRIQEMVNSTEYIHPRTAYQTLCNYGVTPSNELTQVLEAYEALEKELLFLQSEPGDEDTVLWSDVSAELQRIFGTITHKFSFGRYYSDYISSYSPEDTSAPAGVMTRIREEIENYKAVSGSSTTRGWTTYRIEYGMYDENYLPCALPWAQALGLLNSSCDISDSAYGYACGYTLENWNFDVEHNMLYTEGIPVYISIGVGSEDNFNESGLTVRQTRFQTAQENLAYYRNQLITAAVNADQNMVTLLMQLIEGQDSLSLVAISGYLDSLRQQLEYGENMMYQAALAMAASDYAEDAVYRYAYSDSAPKDAAGMIELLRQRDFDETVMTAFTQRMELLNGQEALLSRSAALLEDYQDPETGALTAQQVSAAEAVALLNPVLDISGLTLYGYVEQPAQTEGSGEPTYVRTVLYTGYGSPAVEINGNQATVSGEEPVTLFGKVYLSLEHSLSGALLAFARSQVQTYTPPDGSLSAYQIERFEEGQLEENKNRNSYTMGDGETMYTLNLHTMNAAYALPTNLWLYTGDTDYISADQALFVLYGYCIDLSFRTNVADSNLLLQTEAINRIYNDGETQTDTTMGAGSYMEFTVEHPSYTLEQAQEYMTCLRVAITDTNTGYIYGYAALDMDAADVQNTTIKAPLRLYDKDTGRMIEGDAAQYICHLEQNTEKNLTVYVYLDGAKTSNSFVAENGEQSMNGVLNLQFCSSADLHPVVIDKLLH